MIRTLLVSIAALTLAAPSPDTLLAQQDRYATPVSNRANVSLAMLPMSTSSNAARMHAELGQRALDFGHVTDAQEHFREALAADSTSAFAQLGIANASTTFSEYDVALAAAAKLGEHASRAEQLQIAIAQKTLVNDYAGAEGFARQLIVATPKNPRAYLELAGVQQQMGNHADARATLKKAIAVGPGFWPAYRQLAYSYMTLQPTDPAKAKQYVARMVALEPREAQSFVTQGSYYRAMNQLPLARIAYTRAAELDPTESLALQQRGHVESFLGNYDAARADYDAAARLAKRNESASYAMFRAYVAAHEGNPKQAIAELDALVARIDSMDVTDKLGAKIAALTSEAQMAIETGDFASASRALAQRTPLVREQVAQATETRVKDLVEGDIAYYDGLLAARSGDVSLAKAKADDIMRIMAETSDPRKNQNAHAVLGVLALEQKDFAGASSHLAQANQDDMFIIYERALALEGEGKKKEAKAMFRKVARFNFNGPDVAVVRADAMKRSM